PEAARGERPGGAAGAEEGGRHAAGADARAAGHAAADDRGVAGRGPRGRGARGAGPAGPAAGPARAVRGRPDPGALGDQPRLGAVADVAAAPRADDARGRRGHPLTAGTTGFAASLWRSRFPVGRISNPSGREARTV